jgi:DNA modification methylase
VQKLVADVAAMNARGGEHVDLGLGTGGGGEVGGGSGGGGVALPGDDAEEEEPVIPTDALVKKWKTAPGQLWVVPSLTVPGREHRILCGDSTLAEDLARLLDGASIDMVLTDPPYAIYGSSTGVDSDVADDKMVRPFFERVLQVCRSALKDLGHCYVCCDWRSWAAIWDSAKRAGMSPKNCIVWDKNTPGLGSQYSNGHEFVGFFSKMPPKLMNGTSRDHQRLILRPNVIRSNRPTGDERRHNAAKPRPLFEELITNSSDVRESVLDLFGGSGTTTICAESLGRVSYTMEIEPKNIAIILERLSARGLSPRLVGEGA